MMPSWVGPLCLCVCLAIMIAVTALVSLKLRTEQRRVRDLRARGTSAMARLRDIEPVGGRKYRRYRLTLELPQAGGPPLVVGTTIVVTPLLVRLIEQGVELVPGGSVPVIFAPTDLQNVFVDVLGVEFRDG